MIDCEIADGFCGENCVMDSFRLVDRLVNDIQHLSSEVVRLRYLLSWHLPKHVGETIRLEAVRDLHGGYYEYPTYRHFVSDFCGGHDPLESAGYCNHLRKLSKGEESSEFRSLTF